MELQNKALLLKQLHKFYTKENVPWVKLVWYLNGDSALMLSPSEDPFGGEIFFSLTEEYCDITQSSIGNDSTILFWKDFWSNGEILYDKSPHLF
jgi:hypothetical protein